MKAIRIHRFGPVDNLVEEEVPVPEAGAGEVTVAVHAAGVGPWDALVRTGSSGLPQPLPLTPGSDVAGIVETVGPAVSDLKPGDRVYGSTNPGFTGGYAEHCAALAGMLAPLPETLDFVQAAAVPVVAVTAWQMLFDYGALSTGQRVLIHGAGGSVGGCAVQIAHHTGATVLATASTRDLDRVRGLGADAVIDYRSDRFEDAARDVDLVIDTVGGETQARSYAVLRRGGTLVSSVSQPDPGEAARHGVSGRYLLVEVTRVRLVTIAGWIDGGRLSVEVGEVLPLADARVAHRMLEGASHRPGKIVLAVTP